MSRHRGQWFPNDNPERLLITDIPIITTWDLEKAVRDVIHWECCRPVTREDRIKRDEAFVRLRQMLWHLQDAMKKSKLSESTT